MINLSVLLGGGYPLVYLALQEFKLLLQRLTLKSHSCICVRVCVYTHTYMLVEFTQKISKSCNLEIIYWKYLSWG